MVPSWLGHHDHRAKIREFNGEKPDNGGMTWHYVSGSDAIPGPSATDLRQKPQRDCRKPVREKQE
jgi:hypothetical protein